MNEPSMSVAMVAVLFLMIGRTAAAPTPPTDLVGTEWRLEDLGGRGVIDHAQSTMGFPAAGRIAGSGGCNRYAGSATITGDRITVGPLAATRRACPPAVMDQEIRFLKALERANRIELDGPFLLVHAPGLEKPLKFTRLTGKAEAAAAGDRPLAVSGTVTYRQRIALPPDAVLTVKLIDASKADAPAEVLSEQTIAAPGQVPIRFELPYDPARLRPNHAYQVNARIEAKGALRFISTTAYPVLTRGAPSEVDIVVEPVR